MSPLALAFHFFPWDPMATSWIGHAEGPVRKSHKAKWLEKLFGARPRTHQSLEKTTYELQKFHQSVTYESY